MAASGSGVNPAPTITAGAATGITLTTATIPGTITATGCTAIIAYGIEYSTTINFVNGTGTPVPGSNLAGSIFSVDLSLLTQSTTYYYHTYATNGVGTSYSSQGTFSTLSPTIATSAIIGSPFCVTAIAGASVSVPFTSTGIFSGNTYAAQLSGATGSFTSPTEIGSSLSDANTGTISATIPANTATGTGYRIRVISDHPAITGTDNGADLTINLPVISILPSTPQNIGAGNDGDPLTVAETPAALSREWFYGTSPAGPYGSSTGIHTLLYTPNFAAPGTYYVVCISTFDCDIVTSNAVQIIVTASVNTGDITGSPFCSTASAGSVFQVPFTSAGIVPGNTYTAQLSNASGSFASPVTIGTLSSSANSGSITATILANTATGTAYRIRVISSNPALEGSDNGSDLTIVLSSNRISPTLTQNINAGVNGSTLTVTETPAATSREWFYGTTTGGPYNTSTTITGTTYTPNFAIPELTL